MIHATVNGEYKAINPGSTLLSFITSEKITPEHIVIEHNGVITERARWDRITIGDGDILEIVKFLGGG